MHHSFCKVNKKKLNIKKSNKKHNRATFVVLILYYAMFCNRENIPEVLDRHPNLYTLAVKSHDALRGLLPLTFPYTIQNFIKPILSSLQT